jgi:hypothetical protein
MDGAPSHFFDPQISQIIPQRLKPLLIRRHNGTIKIVPFQNSGTNAGLSRFFAACEARSFIGQLRHDSSPLSDKDLSLGTPGSRAL